MKEKEIHEKAKESITPPENWNDVELREDAEAPQDSDDDTDQEE